MAAMQGMPRIAYIIRFPEDRAHDTVLSGVRRYALARGWTVDILGWDETRTGCLKALHSPTRPIGFIVEGSDLPPNLPLRLQGGAPVVFFNGPRAPRDARFARLLIDEAAVARTAFRELSASLPPACAIVGYWRGRRNWSDDRAAAFRAAASEAALPCHAFSFLDPRMADASGEPARLATWLASLPRHCAVFAVNDETAAIVAKAARDARLNIPRDLTLLGADNDASICETSHPMLSSIQMDFESMGYLAARMLAARMKGRAEHEMKGRAELGMKGRATRERKSAAFAANDGDHSFAPKAHASFGGKAAPSFGGATATLHCGEAAPSLPPSAASSLQAPDGNDSVVAIGPLLAVRRESTGGRGRRETFILQAVEVIRREACDGLTVGALAARFPGSRRLFELRFREAMGCSALDEIQRVRMQKVFTLLASTDTPIGAIADFCGFRSDRALRKLFLAREGMSMAAWRRLHHR